MPQADGPAEPAEPEKRAASSSKKRRDEFRELVSDAEEPVPPRPAPPTSTPADPPKQPDGGGGAGVDSVTRLLSLNPMHDYFVRVALRQFGGLKTSNAIARQREQTPRFYTCCLVIDSIFKVTLMLLAVTALAKGILAPIIWSR